MEFNLKKNSNNVFPESHNPNGYQVIPIPFIFYEVPISQEKVAFSVDPNPNPQFSILFYFSWKRLLI